MDVQLVAQKFYDYSHFIRGYSKATIARYKCVITFYFRFANIHSIDEITEETVRQFFFYGRMEKNWQPDSFKCYYTTLVVFFRWCIHEGYLKAQPVEHMEIPKVEKKLPRKLTKQDALRLLEVAYNYPYDYKFLRFRNHAIFSTFIFAGLRKKELLSLKCTDVDIENLTLFVRQGKGGKDRIIPMSSTLAQSLSTYMQERKRLNKTCPEFFTSLNRNGGFSDSGLDRVTFNMIEASGIKFTIHKLRHTFATLMLEGGCDIYSLSRMMGHSDISTTTIYLSASAEHLRSQMTKHPLNNSRNNNN